MTEFAANPHGPVKTPAEPVTLAVYLLVVSAEPQEGMPRREAFYWATDATVKALYESLVDPNGFYSFQGDTIQMVKITGELVETVTSVS